MFVFRAEVNKLLGRIANRADRDQRASSKQSDLGLHCLSLTFGQGTSLKKLEHLPYL